MLEEDLRELLLSIAEEDALVSTLYAFFIIKRKYTPQIIEKVINHGILIDWFEIVDVNSGIKLNTQIEWKLNNNFQEIVFCDTSVATKHLFNGLNEIPSAFEKFIVENHINQV